MKRSLFSALGLAIAAPMLFADAPADYVVESTSVSETFTSKVLKVYSFSEENVEYVAYVVNWRGHEIVVTPEFMPPGRALAAGDPIRCTMHQLSRQSGEPRMTRLRFTMAPPPGSVPDLLHADPAEQQIRLEAIAAEVERRRAIRQEALNASRSGRTGERPPAP